MLSMKIYIFFYTFNDHIPVTYGVFWLIYAYTYQQLLLLLFLELIYDGVNQITWARLIMVISILCGVDINYLCK